jgi:hypothetical protein
MNTLVKERRPISVQRLGEECPSCGGGRVLAKDPPMTVAGQEVPAQGRCEACSGVFVVETYSLNDMFSRGGGVWDPEDFAL